MVNRHLRENRKTIPIFLCRKKLTKNVTLQILKFYPSKLTNKNFPQYGVMLNFLCFLYFNAVKTDTKLTLHHMGKVFINLFNKIRFKIWRVIFLKHFTINFLEGWWPSGFRAIDDLPRAHWDETKVSEIQTRQIYMYIKRKPIATEMKIWILNKRSYTLQRISQE